jgi:hypothetical protein
MDNLRNANLASFAITYLTGRVTSAQRFRTKANAPASAGFRGSEQYLFTTLQTGRIKVAIPAQVPSNYRVSAPGILWLNFVVRSTYTSEEADLSVWTM